MDEAGVDIEILKSLPQSQLHDTETAWKIAFELAGQTFRPPEDILHDAEEGAYFEVLIRGGSDTWEKLFKGACFAHRLIQKIEKACPTYSAESAQLKCGMVAYSLSVAASVEMDYSNKTLSFLAAFFLTILHHTSDVAVWTMVVQQCLSYIKEPFSENFSDSRNVSVVGSIGMHLLGNMFRSTLPAAPTFEPVFTLKTEILHSLFWVQIQCKATREETTKRLVFPLLRMCAENEDLLGASKPVWLSALITQVWDQCVRLFREQSDLVNASTILCLLLSVPRHDAFAQLAGSTESAATMWELVQECFLHADSVVRKRGVYVLQKLPPKIPDLTCDGLKGKRHWWADYSDAFAQIEGCASPHLIEQIYPYIDHLFYTVSHAPCSELGNTSAVSHTQTSYKGQLLVVPSLQFRWMKGLFQCLLYAPLPTIRRIPLYRLFSGMLTIRLGAEELDWITEELLPNFTDTVAYFSAFSVSREQDIGCIDVVEACMRRSGGGHDEGAYVRIGGSSTGSSKNAGKQSSSSSSDIMATSTVNPHTYPGALIPSFFARVFAACAAAEGSRKYDDEKVREKSDNDNVISSGGLDDLQKATKAAPPCSPHSAEYANLAAKFLHSIVKTACKEEGMKSLSAIKWMFRTFAEPCVQPLLPRCLDRDDLKRVKGYIGGRLSSSNGQVRDQVMQGLVPLLIVATSINAQAEQKQHALSNDVFKSAEAFFMQFECLISLLDVLLRDVGIERLLSGSMTDLSLLKQTIQQAFETNDYPMHGQREKERSEIGSEYGCVLTSTFDEYSTLPVLYAFLEINKATLLDATKQSYSRLLQESADSTNTPKQWLPRSTSAILQLTASLYNSPYQDKSNVIAMLGFLSGVGLTVRTTFEQLQMCEKNRKRMIDSVPLMLFPQLANLIQSSGEISSFLADSIVSALPIQPRKFANASSVGSVVDTMKLFDTSIETLTSLLLIPRVDAAIHTQSCRTTSMEESRLSKPKIVMDDCMRALLSVITHFAGILEAHSTIYEGTNSTQSDVDSGIMKATENDAVVERDQLAMLSTIACRGSAKLLTILMNVMPLPSEDVGLINEFLGCVGRLGRILIKTTPPRANSFKSLKEAERAVNDAADLTSFGNVWLTTPILIDYARGCEQYSRCVAQNLEQRWASIRMITTILPSMISCRKLTAYGHTVEPIRHSSGSHGLAMNDVSVTDAAESLTLLELAEDQLGVCTPEALPHILACCTTSVRLMHAVHRLDAKHMSHSLNASTDAQVGMSVEEGGDTDQSMTTSSKLSHIAGKILESGWAATMGSTANLDVQAVAAFVSFAFDPYVMQSVELDTSKFYYNLILELGLKNRPHIMHCLVSQLCVAFITLPALSASYFDEIKSLLVYKEPRQDDHNVANIASRSVVEGVIVSMNDTESRLASIINLSDDFHMRPCRIMMLSLMEALCCHESVCTDRNGTDIDSSGAVIVHCVRSLVKSLILMNLQPEYTVAGMIGSEIFGEKLRSWQSLCVLSRSPAITADLVEELLDAYFTILGHSCVHSIRVPMEVWGALMTSRFPKILIPRLLKELSDYNKSQQNVASLFVILGHVFVGEGSNKSDETNMGSSSAPLNYQPSLDRKIMYDVVQQLLPWLAGGSGLPRVIAQSLVECIAPKLFEMEPDNNSTAEHSSSSSVVNAIDIQNLRMIYRFITVNKETVKMLGTQRLFYQKFNIPSRTTVKGLMELGHDVGGEIVSDHLLTIVTDFLRANTEAEMATASAVEKLAASRSPTCEDDASTALSADSCDNLAQTLQTKRIPFDELQLQLEEEVLSRQRNAAGRNRQQLIVCASLVDKTANLAGIARTCEIFAVQQLVLPSMGITRSEEFKGIAVSCGEWLPMKEVKPTGLLEYLTSMRSQGYTVVGLEQTDSSQPLQSCALPARSILLLGKEKEGIPVDLLQVVDVCVEIPQFGVIRSLNVHVSAALAVWEITKQNVDFSKTTAPTLNTA